MSGTLAAIGQASWRGIPFEITDITDTPSRNIALHQYPYKQFPYAEDLGTAPNIISINGFILGSPIDIESVYDVEPEIKAAFDTSSGPGVLVHPTRGPLNAVLMRAGMSQTASRLGWIGLSLEFVVVDPAGQGPSSINASAVNTQATSQTYAVGGLVAAGQDFASDVTGLISTGLDVVDGVVSAVSGFATVAETIAGDAGAVIGAVTGLGFILGSSVTLGRYANGNLTQAPAVLSQLSNSLPVQTLLTQARSGRCHLDCRNYRAHQPVERMGEPITAIRKMVRRDVDQDANDAKPLPIVRSRSGQHREGHRKHRGYAAQSPAWPRSACIRIVHPYGHRS